ncbi:hypothetical protein D3C72_1514380 [compost metagenome]
MGNRQQVRDGGKARAVPGPVAEVGIVHAAQVDQLLEAQRGIVAQDAGGLQVVVGLDDQRQFAGRLDQFLHALAESLLERGLQDVELRHFSPCARWCWYA